MRIIFSLATALALATAAPAWADLPPPSQSVQRAQEADAAVHRLHQNLEALSAAVAQAMNQNDLKQAIQIVDEFLSCSNLTPYEQATALRGRADLEAFGGQYDPALADLNAALALIPGSMDVLLKRAHIHFRQAYFADVLADADAMLALHPANGDAHRMKGDVAMEQGRYADAIAAYTAELRADQDQNANVLRALAEEELGQHGAARADIASAAEQGDLTAAPDFDAMLATLTALPPAPVALTAADVALPLVNEGSVPDGIIAPKPIDKDKLEFPLLSRRLNEAGVVVISYIITTDGTPRSIVLLHSSGFPHLDAATIATVLRWRYSPAIQAGKPIPVRTQLRVNWTLNG